MKASESPTPELWSSEPEHADSALQDPRQYEERSRRRLHRLNTLYIPLLRFVGYLLIAALAAAHNRVILETFSSAAFVRFCAVLLGYAGGSWLLLIASYDPSRRFNLAFLVQVLDIPALAFAVLYMGGDESWGFFLLILAVANVMQFGFRKTLLIAHLATVAYPFMILYLELVAHRAVSWDTELVKTFLIYG